jgi:uncharacterized protein YjbJ (UPF0337 family)
MATSTLSTTPTPRHRRRSAQQPTGTTVSARLSSARVGTTAWRVQDRKNAMSLSDKAKNKVEELQGKSKEATGRATGDNKLKTEGKKDQAKAKLKQTGETIKDAFKK